MNKSPTGHLDSRLISQLAEVMIDAKNLESLVRPLLVLLQSVTGLDSTFFTRIDLIKSTQTVLYSHNTAELGIPELLSVSWQDTLCRRALSEHRFCTQDVAEIWGDSQAARALGIQTYLSEPIFVADNTLFGTLCAADTHKKAIDPEIMTIVKLFGQIIARQIEREQLINLLKKQNTDLTHTAHHDPLTGLLNRRGLEIELHRLQLTARRLNTRVHLAFIDLDNFKKINDLHGHRAGDEFLQQVAHRLKTSLRENDLVARYGGDEFVVAAIATPTSTLQDCEQLQRRLFDITQGDYLLSNLTLHYDGASIGVAGCEANTLAAHELLHQADTAMYQAKLARKVE
ncbi:MAG: sensor domain-containing diguanylate cyclase [Halothiobacillus sp.]